MLKDSRHRRHSDHGFWQPTVSKKVREAIPAGRRGSDAAAVAQAAKVIASSKSTLLAAGSVPDAGAHCLDCAAVVLAACAEIWAARGPAAGPRGDALMDALACRVDERDGAVASGETPARVEPQEVTAAASAAVADLRVIARRTGDRADALERLQRSCVELAAIAVQKARDVSERERSTVQPPSLLPDLRRLINEVRARAAQVDAPDQESDDNLAGRSLAEALRIQPSWFALETLEAGDGSGPRVEALLELRSMWIELAARELVLVRWLDRLVDAVAYGRFSSLDDAIAKGSENVLAGSGLAATPSAFDPGLAYAHQFDSLTHAVEALCLGLGGDRQAAERAQQIVLTRLLRSVAAIWLTDAQLDARAPAV